ncbi:MAG: NUDIX hydrolase, partial [Anaerolineaceae bacterium]|nr:NUDIX hydrolase [Anaerolineaceae bacterium]
MDFNILRRNTLFEGPAFNIDRVAVRLPNGREANYDVVSHQGAVTLVPLDQSGNIWFVRQYRTATAQYLLELPAGTLSPDEPTAECAQRELREEIGLAAGKLLKLGDFYLAPG